MSSRRGGQGGQKRKANKNKQAKGSPVLAFPRDDFHNLNLPCCRLLYDVTKDIIAATQPVVGTDAPKQQTQTPFATMLRDQLLQQRKQAITTTTTTSTSTNTTTATFDPAPGKKKKRRKKKKSNAGPAKEDDGSKPEGDEADSITAVQSTASQDSQPTLAATDKALAPSTSAASTASSSQSTATIPAPAAPATPTTPVDLYLDRVLSTGPDPEPTFLPPDMDAFLAYVNEKRSSKGISITQPELEQSFQTISCASCRDAVFRTLRGLLESKQPIILPAIPFDAQSSSHHHHYHHNHNGLAIPIHNQKPDAPPPPAPTMDFDYVAMEEGGSAMGTLLEAKADVAGIPYFHLHSAVDPEPSPEPAATGKKPTKDAGRNPKKPPQIMEWQFVSSSKGSASSSSQAHNNSIITIQDLQHLIKDVMLPLALPPDELLGTAHNLTDEDVHEIQARVQRHEENFCQELETCREEIAKYERNFEELHETEEETTGDIGLHVSRYHDMDDALHMILYEIVMDLIRNHLLWLNGSRGMSVIRPTPAWQNIMAFLTDESTKTIMGMMEAVETYEMKLESDIANAQGKIPEMFVHKGHRLVFHAMIQSKLQLLKGLLESVQNCSAYIEEVWPMTTGGVGSIDMPQHHQQESPTGLLVYFRRKWFADQEFFRKHEEIQQREEAAMAALQTEQEAAAVTEVKKASPAASPNRGKKAAPRANRPNDALSGKCQLSEMMNSCETDVEMTEAYSFQETWVRTSDSTAGHLLNGLCEFSASVKQGRLADIKEEHMVRCQKQLGLLARAAEDCIVPLLAKDQDVLEDAHMISRCQNLWAQIQQQRELQQQEQLLASGDEGPSILEQKHTVAHLTLSSIRLLRNLRQIVADSSGPRPPLPVMPLSIVACITGPQGIDCQNLDVSKCSYNSLVSGAVAAAAFRYPCAGGSGQPRLTSFLLAIFYRKLSELCSEWRADIAQQELLKTMSDADAGVEGSNGCVAIAGGDGTIGNKKDAANKNGVISNAATPAKSKKKSRKNKGDKKAGSTTTEPAGESGELISSTSEADEFKKDDEQQASFVPTESSNGHQKKSLAATEEVEHGNDGFVDTGAAVAPDPRPAVSAPPIVTKEISTARIDEKMGVVDHVGTFQSAESYLVGRLRVLLNAPGLPTSGKKTNKDSSKPVVII